jgi:predicted RNase H-like HicB family nuclease
MKLKYTYYEDDDFFIGWLEEFPDYWTQGQTVGELEENLKDIYDELTSGRIPAVRRVGEIVIR